MRNYGSFNPLCTAARPIFPASQKLLNFLSKQSRKFRFAEPGVKGVWGKRGPAFEVPSFPQPLS
jgi:hypothetical protein